MRKDCVPPVTWCPQFKGTMRAYQWRRAAGVNPDGSCKDADAHAKCRRRIIDRQWVQDNPDKVRAKKHRYNAKNKDKNAAYNKEWRDANPGYERKWANDNPEKVRAKRLRYNKDKPENVRASSRRWLLKAHAEWREIHMVGN